MANGYGQGRSAAGAIGMEESAGKMPIAGEGAPEASEAGFKTTSVSFRPAENGGVIATCSKEKQGPRSEKENYEDRYKSKDYAFASADEAAAFLLQELQGAVSNTTNQTSVPMATGRG